jgi:hypothetical protein
MTTIVEERRFDLTDAKNPRLIEPREIMRIIGITQDHNGGSLAFGPDDFLYIGMGDSGPQRDPRGHGQDLSTHLAKILRIDIDRRDEGRAYAIPADNPFVGKPNVVPEIWAYGFREPWRLSFDRETNSLWVGDVGQDRYEEVAIVAAGENHGWNVYEGFNEFSDQYRDKSRKFTEPVLSYPRKLGVSVTGGYVYRGKLAPRFYGWYIFGDFESRRIWALKKEDGDKVQVIEIGRSPTRIVSFVADNDRELLMVSYDNGLVYRMDLTKADLTPVFRRMLADTSEESPVPWRYTVKSPAANWIQPDFDDAAWGKGPGGFGTVGTPGAIVRTDWRDRDIWLRRTFKLDKVPGTASSLYLRVHHDDDAAVYLNGTEVARLNGWTSGYVDLPLSNEHAALLRAGMNTLAVKCHQTAGGQYIDCGIVEFVEK